MNLNKKISFAGVLVTLGIIFGDIGTSPLYVFKAILNSFSLISDGNPVHTENLILGGLSSIFWTLTIQTTIKYVILTLRADNNGEGGIFSLYALIRKRFKWAVFPAMIGGVFLLADGLITPPISVSSAMEGLRVSGLIDETYNTVALSIVIITFIFFFQYFGTKSIGQTFGPIMLVWFCMLGFFGAVHIIQDPKVLQALNPIYVIKFISLSNYNGFWLIGAVFLCTTGAEALYSDLGHCGKWNIRAIWVFVKFCLLLNYAGQASWLIKMYYEGENLTQLNPFFGLMPEWFVIVGVIIATLATIIASQALITGSFTLIGEAIRMNLWPQMKIVYPTEDKGQLFIPKINLLLYLGCVGIVLYFQKPENMEAAYGLSITLCMLMTSILFGLYLYRLTHSRWVVGIYLTIYLFIELAFFASNIIKFIHGGFVTILIGLGLFIITYVWNRAKSIKARYVEFVPIKHYAKTIEKLSYDQDIDKYVTHLIYLSKSPETNVLEHKILFSIFDRKPKRADVYWIVHVHTTDSPKTNEFKVTQILDGKIIRLDFYLGFRMQTLLDLFFREAIDDLISKNEVQFAEKKYDSLYKRNYISDFKFMVLSDFLSNDNELPFFDRLVLQTYFLIDKLSVPAEENFKLEPNNVVSEGFPLIIKLHHGKYLKRI